MLNTVPMMFGACAGVLAGYMRTRFLLMAMLCLHRTLVGLSCGTTLCVASMYLMEIAPRKIRGLLGASDQLTRTIGIFVAQFVGTELVFGSFGAFSRAISNPSVTAGQFVDYRWKWALGLNIIPALISLPILGLGVETPRFLLISRNDRASSLNGMTVSVINLFNLLLACREGWKSPMLRHVSGKRKR